MDLGKIILNTKNTGISMYNESPFNDNVLYDVYRTEYVLVFNFNNEKYYWSFHPYGGYDFAKNHKDDPVYFDSILKIKHFLKDEYEKFKKKEDSIFTTCLEIIYDTYSINSIDEFKAMEYINFLVEKIEHSNFKYIALDYLK